MRKLPAEFRLEYLVSGRISGIQFSVFTGYSVSDYPANLLSGISLIFNYNICIRVTLLQMTLVTCFQMSHIATLQERIDLVWVKGMYIWCGINVYWKWN